MDKSLILIVDDEHANQFLLEGLLTAQGYTTASASNGEECLEYLKTAHPDLILLDIMMPKMTGTEVLKKIRADDSLKEIPVLMVSAKTGSSDIEESLELGAIDYIRKPFDEVELLARVKVGLRLKQNEDNLRELIHQKDSFVKIISHDLRSPFTAMFGLAEILMESENLTNNQKKTLGYMKDSIEFSLSYFNKLLSWSKLEHQDIQLEKQESHIASLFNNVIILLEKKADEKKITIHNNIDVDLKLNIDTVFFRQVIANIIDNALKFTPVDGNIKCFSKKNGSMTSIIISDSGIGMPKDITTDRLFEKSILVSRRGTIGEKGTGIGLSICKKILDAHEFVLTFEKNPDKGTSFIITSKL